MAKDAAVIVKQLDELRVKFAQRVDAISGLLGKLRCDEFEGQAKNDVFDLIDNGLMAFVDDVKYLAKHGRVASLADSCERDWMPP